MTRAQRMKLRAVLYWRQRGRCAICDGVMLLQFGGLAELQPLFATLDHRLATCAGGTDDIGNLELVHKRCNDLKGPPVRRGYRWRRALGALRRRWRRAVR